MQSNRPQIMIADDHTFVANVQETARTGIRCGGYGG